MSHTSHRAERLPRALLAAAAVLLTTLIAAPAASADSGAVPQLSIAIDNGKTSAKVGDKLSYRIVVKNLGPDRVKKLHITQSMPPGLTADTADLDGAIKDAKVTWVVNLKGASKTTLTTSATVSKTSAQTLRLATVACASASAKSPPIVCASHSDLLAAGAKAEAKAASAADDDGLAWWTYLAGALAAAAAALILVRILRRRTVQTRKDPARRKASAERRS